MDVHRLMEGGAKRLAESLTYRQTNKHTHSKILFTERIVQDKTQYEAKQTYGHTSINGRWSKKETDRKLDI